MRVLNSSGEWVDDSGFSPRPSRWRIVLLCCLPVTLALSAVATVLFVFRSHEPIAAVPNREAPNTSNQLNWNENTIQRLKRLIAFESRCDPARWQALEAGQMPASLKTLQPHVGSTISLTEVLLALAHEGQGANEEFQFEGKDPKLLRAAMFKIDPEWLRAQQLITHQPGVTLLSEECIKTVDFDNDSDVLQVHGSFTFEHPGLCRGRIEFSGDRGNESIQLTQFRLPAHGICVTLTGGLWLTIKLQTATEYFKENFHQVFVENIGRPLGTPEIVILKDSIEEREGVIHYQSSDGRKWRITYTRQRAAFGYGKPEEVKQP